jgi:hypothetical protein
MTRFLAFFASTFNLLLILLVVYLLSHRISW